MSASMKNPDAAAFRPAGQIACLGVSEIVRITAKAVLDAAMA
jgi:hypothetical protein